MSNEDSESNPKKDKDESSIISSTIRSTIEMVFRVLAERVPVQSTPPPNQPPFNLDQRPQKLPPRRFTDELSPNSNSAAQNLMSLAQGSPKPPAKRWSRAEEQALVRYVIEKGARNWNQVSQTCGLESRSPSSCRLKWKNLESKFQSDKPTHSTSTRPADQIDVPVNHQCQYDVQCYASNHPHQQSSVPVPVDPADVPVDPIDSVSFEDEVKEGEDNTGLPLSPITCKTTWEKIKKSKEPTLLTQELEAKIGILHLEHGNNWSHIADQLPEDISSLDVQKYWESRKKARENAGIAIYSDEELQEYIGSVVRKKTEV
ncbi:Octamer-binding transcription factor [Trema orientale]|uniref:Octamer-binding transcription factor n=1 Tax=Trema orientale TaxID=63057 RepID=A0A2P5FC31_TREOI|nr:Octamer-binding transcription factor [Trema orientale]